LCTWGTKAIVVRVAATAPMISVGVMLTFGT
jgi:hypothetical protein